MSHAGLSSVTEPAVHWAKSEPLLSSTNAILLPPDTTGHFAVASEMAGTDTTVEGALREAGGSGIAWWSW